MIYYVFLHGFPDLPSVWDVLLKELPQDQKFYVPNLWQTGFENGKALTSDQVAAKIFHTLKQDGFSDRDQLYILGHDLGAAYAVALAQLAPQQTTLFLMNGMTPQMLLARMKSAHQLLKSWYIWLMQLPFFADAVIRLDHKLPRRIATIAHRPAHPEMCSKQDFVTGVRLYRKLFRESFHSHLPPHKAKKLILVWGIQDPFLNTPTEAEFAHLAHEVEIHLLNDHHWPQLHSYQQVAKIIDANT